MSTWSFILMAGNIDCVRILQISSACSKDGAGCENALEAGNSRVELGVKDVETVVRRVMSAVRPTL